MGSAVRRNCQEVQSVLDNKFREDLWQNWELRIYVCVCAYIFFSPWYISLYKYIECIVGRVPLNIFTSSQSNVDKHVGLIFQMQLILDEV